MGSEGDGVPVKHSPAGAHRVAESKPEQEAVVVVKNPEEQRSQKSRGLQWSHRRVVEGRGNIGTVLAEGRRSLERQVSHPKNISWFGSFFS